MILNNMKHNISNYNSNNTINNNITINNYGEENIDYITNKILTKLIKDPNSCLPKLINLKHFHPHHPENRNKSIISPQIIRSNRLNLIVQGLGTKHFGPKNDLISKLQFSRS